MVFSGIPFLFFFLPICLLLYYIVPNRAKNPVLLLFSIVFYAWGEPVYIFLMLATSLLSYLTALIVDKTDKTALRKTAMTICIIISLSFLGFFKYSNFLIDQINVLFNLSLNELDLSLPIGISFYTFLTLSYNIDVYRKKYPAEKNILDFMTYATMFPHIISGPIVRYSYIKNDLHERKVDFDCFSKGMMRLSRGLFKKVLIANNIGILWNSINAESANGISVMTAWLGAAAFTLQLYFDFSGYTDMAIGIGKMLGFTFNENFDHPFISKSVTEFWRRWHMSLSSWFRDYVYIPLGGNRKGILRNIINILLVWALTGFWHGAAWNFMFWGLYYGVLLILEKFVWGKLLEKMPNFIRHVYLILIVVFGFTIFVFDDTTQLFHYIKLMFGIGSTSFVDNNILFFIKNYYFVLIPAVIFSMPVYSFALSKIEGINKKSVKKTINIALISAYVLLFVGTISYIVGSTYNSFLYFKF